MKKKTSSILKEFLKNTNYCPGFLPSEYEVIHVDEGKLTRCSNLAEAIETDKPYSGKLTKVSFAEYGTYLMNKNKGFIFKLDENCRSQLLGFANTKGSFLYNGTVFADLALEYALPSIKKPLKVVVRDNAIISALSSDTRLKNPLDTVTSLEKAYKVDSFELDNYHFKADYVVKTANSYKYLIRFQWSDAGEVAYRLEGCMKPDGAERAITLFAADTIEKIISGLEPYYSADMSVVFPSKTVNTALKALGNKRLKNLQLNGSLAQLVNVPDIVGNINKTTDNEVSKNIGELITMSLKR